MNVLPAVLTMFHESATEPNAAASAVKLLVYGIRVKPMAYIGGKGMKRIAAR
jgi:hypothetical protein